ncbi:NAD(+)/NADH kinase [Persicirhabdus sediminis]|uniref:NAD kinase n=1 Tax=Persicirhabdus sediminis TaxID=454144 RepID=A0A8J7SJM2_9BACT|nr:NAD(+)/NADH kinase [Persicirhabdus sediminis]MBK1791201.1 NAD(+)/NADH kinase [Persicirhabdus sediminis]
MKFGIIANTNKDSSPATLASLCKLLKDRGHEWVLETDTSCLIENGPGIPAAQLKDHCDIIAVLGGDGTMLNASYRIGACTKPIAGINTGHLGFLTSCSEHELERLISAIENDKFTVSPHTLLTATIESTDGSQRQFTALNEVTLTRGHTSRMVSLDTRINGEVLNQYRADGLIVATPTGSTAYSLSAGGPLVAPDANIFLVTPICPHSLSNRTMVVADSSLIEVTPSEKTEETLFFNADGRDIVEVKPGSHVKIKKAAHVLPLLTISDTSFFKTVRTKLRWH